MTDISHGFAIGLLAVGGIVVLSVIVRCVSSKIFIPAVVSYILIGMGLALMDGDGTLFPETARNGLELLAEIGIIAILFRVGLESDLESLFRVLGKAAVIFVSNFAISGLLGFAVILLFTDFGFVPALFVGAALSATSVGVSTAVWRDAGVLDTESGALLVDVAELDDISAVIVVALLFAMAPLLGGVSDANPDASLGATLATEGAYLLFKLALLIAACYLFTRYLEDPLVALFRRLDPRLGPMMLAFGVALLIAATAELINLSLPIGALLAGLAFSSPPTDKLIDEAFDQIYLLFSPFFFLSIGMAVNGAALSGLFALTTLLLTAAIIGKLIGTGLPVAWLGPKGQAWLFGASMVPRAEIALIVMSYGLALGAWAVPAELYSAMVLVSLATCIIAPIAVTYLLRNGERPSHEAGE